MSGTIELQLDALEILNAAPDNYLILLPDAPHFTIVGVTDAYLKATFTKRDDIMGKGIFEVFPDNPQLQDATGVYNLSSSLHYVLEHKCEHRMADQRYDVPRPEGDGFVFKVWRPLNRPVLNALDDVKFIIHHVEDVTELTQAQQREVEIKNIEQAYRDLKKTENLLKESEERFRTMANSIPQLAWMTDPNGWIYWYNDRWYEYTGTTPEEMVGWGWQKVHHPNLVDGVVRRIKEAFDSGNFWEDIFLLRSKDGEYRWFLARAMPVRKKDGRLIGWFGTNADITQQRQTEEALQRSEQQLLLALEGGQLGYFDYDLQTGELQWSARTKELFGLAPDTRVDLNLYFEALYPEDRERTRASIQKALDPTHGVYEHEYRVIRRTDGRLRWIRSKGKVFFDPDGNAYRLSGVILDITNQKQAEHVLQQSESNLRNLVLQAPVAMCIAAGASFVVEVANDRMLEIWGNMDFIPQMIWLTRPDGYHYYFNGKWYDYTGLTFSETEGDGWQGVCHPDDVERTRKLWRHSLATGEPYETEFRCRRHDGQYRWFLTRALPLKDDNGNIIKWFGTDTDIHDRKTFIEQLESMVAERTSALQQSNEDLQQFVHVSSHDLKEPVRKIRFFSNRLCDEASGALDAKNRIHLSRVQASAERMAVILEGVMTYSKVNFLEELYEAVDLNEVIRDVEADLELPIKEKKAVIDYSNLPELEGAPIMLHLVFYNLVSNSLKFSRVGIPPVIAVSADIIKQNAKSFARIEVRDNGVGFEQKYAEKIFGTFIRLHTKDKYEGAGLGLSICKKIIERHGGTIAARSRENAGAVFEILLPMRKVGTKGSLHLPSAFSR